MAETVVLLHGLGRTSVSMLILEARLRYASFAVVNRSYPSRRRGIEALAARAPAAAMAEAGPGPVHFVTHSLGGVILRAWLAAAPRPEVGRVVMLGPPLRGAALAGRIAGLPGGGYVLGPAGRALARAASLQTLPHPRPEIGVIAGDRSLNPIFSAMIDGPDDGKVGVAETLACDLTDHIVMPVSHSFMMNSPSVTRRIIRFLKTGRFRPA